ncbi:Gfo/Idh/MocA family oxidoreductase [Sphingomonas cannabina]|uniref:Gfo/Idh/MocA family protein n=1 Tax=Sphingomonas cannabina TaxID=2899123 RepID=UPI001F40091D|nr:Gfo/Idh/MocA family oxidoreductase [Sphingomonas cannabina]UIJ44441.1 Gfo/Idh/MocA family oxidoreductase [Sphingomonas cannabina]
MTAFVPIKGRKVRFALVGCGRISKNHLDALGALAEDAELVDVCDIDPAALRAAGERSGATCHDSLDAMLASTTADAVILTTPSGIHPAQAIAVARSGRHVVSEKPMATRWSDGLRMVRECDEAGVRLFVVKQNRRNATLQMLKRAIEADRFGRIYLVALNVFWTRPQDYYDAAKWRGTWEFDGGALMNQASHYIDLLSWLIGPVESVQAYSATLARKIEAEDTAVASLRWRSGALGSLSVTMLTYPKNLEGSITVLGEKGTARIGGVAVNEMKEWSFAEPHPDDAAIEEASYHTTSVYGFGHPLYYRNVIDVLRGEAEPETDGRAGLQSLELLTAIYRAARDGTRVALPLERSA